MQSEIKQKEIEDKFGLFIVGHQGQIIITSLGQNQYTFLQRLNQFKAYLMNRGQRLKPLKRISEDTVIAIIEAK